MPDKPWKVAERRIAKLLGGNRVPITGRQRGDAPDIGHDWLSIEVKSRKQLPAWLLEAMEQAQQSANGGQLPVVVLHQHRKPYTTCLVVLGLGDFIDWFGDNEEEA